MEITQVLPTLEKKQDIFKIIISDFLENKIRYLCSKISSVEWSGVLFYIPEGSIETNDLVIRAIDLFPMDIGTSAYTSFNTSPDTINYMVNHLELMEPNVNQGLIHSHNTFGTFFSGTDTSTLQKEGSDQNHFVSLIVNNEGKYTAGITRKVEKIVKGEITSSYKSFANLLIPGLIKPIERIEETIEWFELKVEIEDDPLKEEINSRLEEIKIEKQKTLATIQSTNYSLGTSTQVYNREPNDWKEDWDKPWPQNKNYSFNNKEPKQLDLPFEETPIVNKPKSTSIYEEIPYGVVYFNKTTLNSILLQLVTGSVVLPNQSKIDIKQWVKSMPSVFTKRFGLGKLGESKFGYWADSYIDFLLQYAEDDHLIMEYDEDEVQAICAYDLIQALKELEGNKYIDEFIKILESYIV